MMSDMQLIHAVAGYPATPNDPEFLQSETAFRFDMKYATCFKHPLDLEQSWRQVLKTNAETLSGTLKLLDTSNHDVTSSLSFAELLEMS